MKFATYGPFLCGEQTPTATVSLFNQIESRRSGLEHGLGVYFFICDGDRRPLYVGKSTRRDFGGRIIGHLDDGKFVNLFESCGTISVYLLAALDDKGQLKSKLTISDDEASYIGELECSFIGTASQNSKLLNVQSKMSTGFVRTPGVLDDEDPQGKASAKTLSEILNIQ